MIALFIWGRTIVFDKNFAPVIYAESGEVLSASVSSDQQWRIQCNTDVPEKLKTAIILFEDEYFYSHPGVNLVSISKATYQNIKAGKIKRGGSTLTMQLARIHYKNQRRSYIQKIKEIFLSIAIELNYSKEEIIANYCQYAPFGGNIIGYCAASYKYYDKEPELLSWSESVTLAVLPNAPSDVFPGKGQKRLQKKRNYLLKKLLAKKYIDSTTYRLSLLESIPTQSNHFDNLAPHLLTNFKKHKLENNHTTINYNLQKSVINLVQNYHDRYVTNGIDNMAVLILRNNGEIASYVSNTSCKTSDCGKNVDIIHAFRSPGSILKPFLYGLSLDKGSISPTSILLDIPSFYNGFSPKNFDRKFRGIIPAKDALTMSLNVPAVNLLSKYGIDGFITDMKNLGYKNTSNNANYYGLSLILGGNEVSMMEVGQSYMNLVRTADGELPIMPIFSKNQTIKNDIDTYPISRGGAWLVLQMLSGVNRPSSQEGWQYFTNKKNISWKTGTSYGYRDAWSVGVTKDYTVVVWIGNADGEGKKGLTGIKKAAPVLFSVFDLLPDSEEISLSYKDLSYQTICKQSGYTANDDCPETIQTLLPKSSHNLPLCSFHKTYSIDATGKYLINSSCDDFSNIQQKVFFVLNPVANSYYKKYSTKDYSLPPLSPNCMETAGNLAIIYPMNNSTILLPKDINKIKQELICNATTAGEEKLYWFLDDQYLEETTEYHKIKLSAKKGRHQLTIVSPSGDSKTHRFEVIE